jgi:hypothetical protein
MSSLIYDINLQQVVIDIPRQSQQFINYIS